MWTAVTRRPERAETIQGQCMHSMDFEPPLTRRPTVRGRVKRMRVHLHLNPVTKRRLYERRRTVSLQWPGTSPKFKSVHW